MQQIDLVFLLALGGLLGIGAFGLFRAARISARANEIERVDASWVAPVQSLAVDAKPEGPYDAIL